MFFHYRSFAHVLDLLRNEGPIELVLNTDTRLGYVTTERRERIGEGERFRR
jgi:hypothetical protein